jgi:uncharacterized protein YukJ
MEPRENEHVSPHIHLFFQDDTSADRVFTAAINVKSKSSESRLVFWHQKNFHNHSIIRDLRNLRENQAFYPLPNSEFSSLKGLDYTHDKSLIPNFPEGGILLEHDIPGRDNDLLDKMRPILRRAIEDRATVYVFGSKYNSTGIHDIHMNQGSLLKFENGVNQDGAIIVQYDDHWEAVFFAFGTQRVPTKDGLPIPGSTSLAVQLDKIPLTPERD